MKRFLIAIYIPVNIITTSVIHFAIQVKTIKIHQNPKRLCPLIYSFLTILWFPLKLSKFPREGCSTIWHETVSKSITFVDFVNFMILVSIIYVCVVCILDKFTFYNTNSSLFTQLFWSTFLCQVWINLTALSPLN